MANVKVGLVQMSCVKDTKANLHKAIDGIRKAAHDGAQIVCLQELFTSLYFCDVEDYDNFELAETIPGPSTDVLSKVAKELNVVIIASLFEKRAAGLYHNTTAILDADGSLVGVNFDRAYTATINDYAWNEAYSRSVAVDIRYVLWTIQKVAKSQSLMNELGL